MLYLLYYKKPYNNCQEILQIQSNLTILIILKFKITLYILLDLKKII